MNAPWWLRIAAKLLLSRLPVSYRTFANLGIFRHGRMHDPDYAISVFSRHFARAENRLSAERLAHPDGFVALEFGVGDSIAATILARARGATRSYLIDAGRYAVEDTATYRRLIEALRNQGVTLDEPAEHETFEQLLARFGGTYLTDGLASLRQIPDASVDFAWSNAVLEHVRHDEFAAVQTEFRRIMKPDGVISHRVDLKDHLGGALNNRRVSSNLWERDWFAQSGFYTNRISFDAMLQTFEAVGFAVEVLQIDRWDSLPTPRASMAPEFQELDDAALRVSGFDVVLRPA